MLAGVGGAAGIAVAWAGARLIVHLAFQAGWVPVSAAPSMPVVLFALAVSLMTALLFGIVPALITSRADPMDAMRGSTRTASDTTGAQKALVIAQTAVSVVLLSAAAMLGQSLYNLEHQNLGFAADGRYLVSIDSKLSNPPQKQLLPLFREIDDRLRALPGVRTASAALYAPMSGSDWSHDVRIAGRPEPGAGDDVSSAWTRVMPGFFETIGDRIVRGRPIVDADASTTRRVAVINEAFARKFFPNENPIGEHFGPAAGKNAGLYEIVGVAADVRYFPSTVHAVRPMYFVPEAQGATFDDRELESRELWSHYLYNVVIWAPGNPPGLAAAVRDRLAAVAPDFVMNRVQPYADVVRRQFAQQDMIASLTWLFGAIGLLLAAVGLYGITGVHRRAADGRDWRAYGARRGPGVGRRDGAARGVRAGQRRIGARHSRGDRLGRVDREPVVRRAAVGPGAAGMRRAVPRRGDARRGVHPGTARGGTGSDAGVTHRIESRETAVAVRVRHGDSNMTMLAHLRPCITRQRPGVDTIRDDGAAEREVVRCYGLLDFVSNAFDRKTLDASVARSNRSVSRPRSIPRPRGLRRLSCQFLVSRSAKSAWAYIVASLRPPAPADFVPGKSITRSRQVTTNSRYESINPAAFSRSHPGEQHRYLGW